MASKKPRHRPGDLVIIGQYASRPPGLLADTVLRVVEITGRGTLRDPWGVVVEDADGIRRSFAPGDLRPVSDITPDDGVFETVSRGVAQMGGGKRGAPKRTRTRSPAQLDAEIAVIVGDASVVVAWTEDVQEIAPGQKAWRHDLGERPRFVDAKKAHAAMWVNRGSQDDVVKATSWVRKEYPTTGRVFVFPMSEKDPLGRARREVLK